MNSAPPIRNLVGQVAVSAEMKVLGTITSQTAEDGKNWAVINDDYEVPLAGCDFCMDVMGVWRRDYPNLPAEFVRLAP